MSAGDIITAVFLPLGAAFSLIGCVGLLRFPDLYGRLHAATKPDTVGLIFILIGAAPQLRSPGAMVAMLLVAMFQLMTMPVVAATLGRVAYGRGEVDASNMIVDELAEDLREVAARDEESDDGAEAGRR
ncbi:monovalent cation/H(+) antiporter subunit G [Allonocardiopsis opalescens]|uniref:Multisubunit sodium/proton antiporter MrpG subunit n=1 Tax=Allonocardiopsis opalescens TaxID=1144618 RepID=A0A2T0Q0P1_9ACTN|nr:monovalent cation/H(+) antiporter subunit G [Allonocardiopsis opalescens]PRX97336.1 multisubunit sodium/proton antiporter MrpG subunit [Allonocardiopsis opalescens]